MVGYRSWVRWSVSLGEWVRREKLLAAVLAGCVGLFAAGAVLAVPELAVVGAVVAAGGGLMKTVLVLKQVIIEGRRENLRRVGISGPLSVSWRSCPTDIGIKQQHRRSFRAARDLSTSNGRRM